MAKILELPERKFTQRKQLYQFERTARTHEIGFKEFGWGAGVDWDHVRMFTHVRVAGVETSGGWSWLAVRV